MILADIPGILAFRFLPFLGYLTFASDSSRWRKAVGWALFALFVSAGALGGRDMSEVLVRGPLALLYFVSVSLGLYAIAGRSSRPIGGALLFALCAVLYLLVPAFAYRTPLMIATLGVGWEAMLSAYSFFVESKKERSRPSRADCLFFILVNPCLVYTERGKKIGPPRFSLRNAGRTGLGVAAWGAQALAGTVLVTVLAAAKPDGYGAFVVRYGGALLTLYFAHSGLASVQIGFANMVGHDVPERYHYPLFSSSPEEFWRRWNAYVGSWIRRYVYYPVALRARRARPHWPSAVTLAAAIVVSFLTAGILHDYSLWLQNLVSFGSFHTALTLTPVFVAYGLLLLLWHGPLEFFKRILEDSAVLRRIPSQAWRIVSCVCFLQAAFAMMWLLETRRLAQ